MKKIIVLMLAFCSGQLLAQNIEPFGGLSWTNGLWTAVNKVAKIEGVEQLNVNMMFDGGSMDAKGISSQTEFTEKVNKLVLANFAKKTDLPFGNAPGKLSKQNTPFTDKDNKKWDYNEYVGVRVICSPIVIKQVPFKMTLEFSYAPGQVIANPDDVVFLKDLGLAFPLILTKVELESDSPTLSNKKTEIINLLIAKYGSLNSSFADGLTTMGGSSVSDQQDRKLGVSIQDGFCQITYSSNFEKMALDKKYTDHLSEAEKSKIGNKPDASSGL